MAETINWMMTATTPKRFDEQEIFALRIRPRRSGSTCSCKMSVERDDEERAGHANERKARGGTIPSQA
jgi:hypothetical protein